MALKPKNTATPEASPEVEQTTAADPDAAFESTLKQADPAATAEGAGELVDDDAGLEAQEQVQSTGGEVTVGANNPPALSRGNALGELAAAGYEGLEINWTSFPTVVLGQAEFELADGSQLEKQTIDVAILQTRKRYVVRTKVNSEDDDPELCYTYNIADLQNPDSEVAKKVKQWKDEEGLDYVIKEYIEAMTLVMDPEHELNDQMVLLQIPPSSIGRFSGYLTSNKLTKKGDGKDYITRCSRGEKVTKAAKPFYPWHFQYVGPVAG